MTSPTGDVVVCDASPLIVLARVEQLALLQKLFVNVYAPPAVWSEAIGDASAPGADVLLATPWIRVRAPSAVPASRLGLGEREAMGLAAELSAVLVVDDRAARAEAVALGVRITGTLGILRRAKREGLQDARAACSRSGDNRPAVGNSHRSGRPRDGLRLSAGDAPRDQRRGGMA